MFQFPLLGCLGVTSLNEKPDFDFRVGKDGAFRSDVRIHTFEETSVPPSMRPDSCC